MHLVVLLFACNAWRMLHLGPHGQLGTVKGSPKKTNCMILDPRSVLIHVMLVPDGTCLGALLGRTSLWSDPRL